MNTDQTLEKTNSILGKNSLILDIGAGAQQVHAKWFRGKGHKVDTCDFFNGSTYVGDFNSINIDQEKYDCVWASHVLEHQLNVNLFLKKCWSVLKPDGIISVTVPPRTTYTAGGHLTQWNPGMLIYNLILAGFDCSNCSIKQYDYNQSVIAQKKIWIMPKLKYDRGDLITLKPWLPKNLKYEAYGHFEGDIKEYNW